MRYDGKHGKMWMGNGWSRISHRIDDGSRKEGNHKNTNIPQYGNLFGFLV